MVVDCVVRGDPIPNVTFHKEDQHLQRGDNVSASRWPGLYAELFGSLFGVGSGTAYFWHTDV